jgi:hypothetical protein
MSIQRFNQNYSDAAIVSFRLGSSGSFDSPERTQRYVRKAKLPEGPELGKNSVASE